MGIKLAAMGSFLTVIGSFGTTLTLATRTEAVDLINLSTLTPSVIVWAATMLVGGVLLLVGLLVLR